jgi:rare lipoprotein A
MRPVVAQRLIAVAALGLLVALVGLAVFSERGDSGPDGRLPERIGPWRYARAAPLGRQLEGATTACGVRLRRSSMGIADPVLPCGAKLYVGYGGEDVLTQVIATGPVARGARFGITPALAEELGIEHGVTVRWSYAR